MPRHTDRFRYCSCAEQPPETAGPFTETDCAAELMDSPSGRAGLCGSGTQSGAEAVPPHTLSHRAKGVQELRLQEKGVRRHRTGSASPLIWGITTWLGTSNGI